jgi:dihydroxyacid dehydratase/phosphogluconate dehydratase
MPYKFSVSGTWLNTQITGAFSVGKINDEQRLDVVRHACPGAGACGGMYTYAFFHMTEEAVAEGSGKVLTR